MAAFEGEFALDVGDGRTIALSALYSAAAGDASLRGRKLRLSFDGTESFKVSYLHAVNVDVVWNAADKIIDIGRSEYLTETEMHLRLSGGDAQGLRHLVFYPGGVVSYEFVCRGFRVEVV